MQDDAKPLRYSESQKMQMIDDTIAAFEEREEFNEQETVARTGRCERSTQEPNLSYAAHRRFNGFDARVQGWL